MKIVTSVESTTSSGKTLENPWESYVCTTRCDGEDDPLAPTSVASPRYSTKPSVNVFPTPEDEIGKTWSLGCGNMSSMSSKLIAANAMWPEESTSNEASCYAIHVSAPVSFGIREAYRMSHLHHVDVVLLPVPNSDGISKPVVGGGSKSFRWGFVP
jgi:hypothetical protein